MTDSRAPRDLNSKLRDFYALTKPEVNLLILMTTSAGYYLASTGPFRFFGLANTLLGTLLVASGTATLNQWMERRWDAQMRRTANRPLPSGRLSAQHAFWFGVLLSVSGVLYLTFAVNKLSAILAASTLLSYLLVYTPLKRKSALCTLLGAFPGAMPTLIGWAGASGSLDMRAGLLFSVLFLWQFPHFLAIALMYREDYARAGYLMLPRFDVDGRFTRAEILVLSAVCIAVTMLPVIGHAVLMVAMAASGAFFLYYAVKVTNTSSTVAASRVVHASVIYLPLVLVILGISKGRIL